MKLNILHRHTCEGRYPVSVGLSKPLDSCLRSNEDIFQVNETPVLFFIHYNNNQFHLRWLFL